MTHADLRLDLRGQGAQGTEFMAAQFSVSALEQQEGREKRQSPAPGRLG